MAKNRQKDRILFISDLHFGHANCIRFDSRPWDTVEEMDADLIRRWNNKVNPQDHVYVLGDFAHKNKTPVAEYLKQLNGFVHLIRGNHDKRNPEAEKCFREVLDYKEMTIEVSGVRVKVIMSHYFIPFYNGQRHMAIMLHGHTHKTNDSVIEEKIKEQIRSSGVRCEAYNVGCMWQDYEPQTLEEIIRRQGREISII